MPISVRAIISQGLLGHTLPIASLYASQRVQIILEDVPYIDRSKNMRTPPNKKRPPSTVSSAFLD